MNAICCICHALLILVSLYVVEFHRMNITLATAFTSCIGFVCYI